MKIRSERDKRNYLIIALCLIVVIMGVGYASFSSLLTINGTANISNSWNIKITNIRSVNPCVEQNTAYLEEGESKTKLLSASVNDTKMKKLGGKVFDCSSEAYDKSLPTHTDTTATFHTGLVKPGDIRLYEIEVKNLGSIDAEVTKTLINNVNSDAIVFSYDGVSQNPSQIISIENFYEKRYLDIAEPFELNSGETKYIYITVGYDSSVTSQPSNLTASITVELNATQKVDSSQSDSGGSQGTDEEFTGSIYRWNGSEVKNGFLLVPGTSTKWCANSAQQGNSCDFGYYWDTEQECNQFVSDNNMTETICQQQEISFEGIEDYTTDPTTLEKDFYLKHDVVEDIITESYVCFVYNNAEHCMKGGDGGASYSANQQILRDFQTFNNLPDNANPGCSFDSSTSNCHGGGFDIVDAYSDGSVYVYGSSSEACSVDDAGYSACGV